MLYYTVSRKKVPLFLHLTLSNAGRFSKFFCYELYRYDYVWNLFLVKLVIKLLRLVTLMFDINHGTAPQYLSELVRRCDDTRLRSNVRGDFVVSRTRLHVTDKAFSITGPCAWNALPSHMKLITSHSSFRKTLKTHLFSLI